jgi:two-component system, OmpR family, KDP operon response regulator KdpE
VSRILCVDDEPHLLRTLGANLRARGYEVDLAATGERALEVATATKPDLVVVDLGLPGMSGMEVIRSLRRWTAVPIVVLSARDSEFDKVGALDAGADDYVAKPFGMGELLARVRAALRRPITSGEVPAVVTDAFTVDLSAQRVVTARGDARLTPTEWHLVEVLVRRAGRLVSSRDLLQAVWGPQYGEETNYLRVHMAHIRRKLEPEPSRPRYFHTEPGLGYRFEPQHDRTSSEADGSRGDGAQADAETDGTR